MMTIRDVARPGYGFAAFMSISGFRSRLRSCPAMLRFAHGVWPGAILTAGIQVFAFIRISQTEFGLFGQGLCILTWILLNCVVVLMVRRAALAAAISLGLMELLILLSQFKFKI